MGLDLGDLGLRKLVREMGLWNFMRRFPERER